VRQVTIDQVEVSEVNFVELVHTLLDNPDEKAHFFEVRRTGQRRTSLKHS